MSSQNPKDLFPDGVAFESIDCFGNASPLSSVEQFFVQRAVTKRVQEFRAGRHCARRAMAAFGVTNFDLVVGKDRQPIWPAGLVGSITHTSSIAAAVVAKQSSIQAVGLDVERAAPLPSGVCHTIATKKELVQISCFSRATPWDCLIFSAKEAFYKAWYPQTGLWLDFQDVTVTLCPASSTFSVKVESAKVGDNQNFFGRFLIANDLIWTGVSLTVVG